MRILGIDLGKSGLKAVEIDSAFGRYDIHDYHEHPLAPDENPQEAITQLIKSLPKAPERIVVCLTTGEATFRNLQLPTRDKKAIQSGVAFELEDELPFSPENACFDYVILSQNKQGSSVHVAASLKRHLQSKISLWEEAGANPDVISTEAWAYRALLNRILEPMKQDTPTLLVHIGSIRTTLYLHWRSSPLLVKEIPWGGRDLTTIISEKYELPFEQAEAIKLDQGSLNLDDSKKDISPEQKELSGYLEQALEELSTEIRQIELMSKSITRHSISSIYLAGGTTLLPGLGTWIERKLNTPTQKLLALSSVTTSGVTYSDQTDARFLLPVSLALTVVGPDRANCINFRKGAFAKEGKQKELDLNALKKPRLALGIILGSLFLSLTIQSSVYKSLLKTADASLEKSIKGFFGQELSNSALKNYKASPSTLRNNINKELAKQRELSKLMGPHPYSPLDFLNTLSETVPKDIVLDMTQFQAGMSSSDSFVTGDPTGPASLTFLVSNPQSAERLTSAVGAKIASMQRTKNGRGPGSRRWREEMENYLYWKANRGRLWKIIQKFKFGSARQKTH